MLNVRSVADMDRAIANNAHLLAGKKLDCVVGIPRSGLLAASLLATRLQLPLADTSGYPLGLVHGRGGKLLPPGSRILLVDDTVNKGRAMAGAVAELKRRMPHVKIHRVAVYGPYQVDNPEQLVDTWFEHCQGPRVFTWNMAKHKRLPRWGFDMDGVLCRDPTNAENDDGPAYEKFLASAEPMFRPRRPIGHIVTGRLEKYRAHTEAWLKAWGVAYTSLVMMPYATKAERMAAGSRGAWKASVAKNLGVEFFIESDPKQAAIIAGRVGIPVWCTETQSLASVA